MQLLPLNLLEGRPSGGAEIIRLEFFFDKLVIALMFFSAALGVIGDLISDTSAFCTPPDNVTNPQGLYINNYCSQNLPQTIYLPYFVVARGIVVLVPHYIWVLLYEGDIRSFFSAVSKLDICRDPSTGRFHDKTVQRVKYLENKFTHKKFILYLAFYTSTLIIQLLLLIASLSLSFVFELYNLHSSYSEFVLTFNCSLEESILPPSVPCYHGSLLISPYPSLVDLIIVVIAILAVIGQTIYIYCPHEHHVKQGLNEAAEFSFETSLPHEYYKYGRCGYCLGCNTLELTSLVLSRSSHGHYSLLRDIQIEKKVQKLRSDCINRLQLEGNNQQENHVGQLGCEIRRIVLTRLLEDQAELDHGLPIHRWYNLPANLLIFAISFGPCAYYNFCSTARPKIMAINFTKHVNEVIVNSVCELNVISIQVPSDIYRQSQKNVKDFHDNVSKAIKEVNANPKPAKQVYIIGPTNTYDKNRVLTVCKYIETLNQDLPRHVVSVCPSNRPEYESFAALNGMNLTNFGSIEVTCGKSSYKFDIKVLSWDAPNPPPAQNQVVPPAQNQNVPPLN